MFGGYAHHLAHFAGFGDAQLGDDGAQSAFQFSLGELLGEILLKNTHLSQFVFSEIRPTLLGEYFSGFATLFGQFLQNLQGIGVGEFVVGSGSGFSLKKHLFYVAQRVAAHGIFGLHGLLDAFGYVIKQHCLVFLIVSS